MTAPNCIICRALARSTRGRITTCMRHSETAANDCSCTSCTAREDRRRAEQRPEPVKMVVAQTKRCGQCGAELPLGDFCRNPLSRDGRGSTCVECDGSRRAEQLRANGFKGRAQPRSKKREPATHEIAPPPPVEPPKERKRQTFSINEQAPHLKSDFTKAPPKNGTVGDPRCIDGTMAHLRKCGEPAISKDIPGWLESHPEAKPGHEWQVCVRCGHAKEILVFPDMAARDLENGNPNSQLPLEGASRAGAPSRLPSPTSVRGQASGSDDRPGALPPSGGLLEAFEAEA